MKNHIALLLIIVILSGCFREQREQILKHDNLTVVDHLPPGYMLLEYDSQSRSARYHVYYVGGITDTIEINKPISGRRDITEDYDTILRFASSLNNLRIEVDTDIQTPHTICQYHIEENRERLIGSSLYQAYPVFVYNLSDSFISLGMFNRLTHMVRQAKNDKGQWQDIELPTQIFCGYGARDIVANPHQIIVAKLLRYKGDFYTECRLKLERRGQYQYSNSFFDFIDKRQLTDTLKVY